MEVEKYHQTGSRVLGVVGLGLALIAVVTLASDGVSRGEVAWLGGLAVMALLSWAALIRPQVRLTAEDLVLRNMLLTVTVPLAVIDDVAVGRMLVVVAGDRRFVSPAVARPQREVMRGRRDPDPAQLPNFVEDRVRARADAARVELRARHGQLAPDVRREPAWLEIGLLALSVLVLLVGVGL